MGSFWVKRDDRTTRPIHVVVQGETLQSIPSLPTSAHAWLEGIHARVEVGRLFILPGADGKPAAAVLGVASLDDIFSYGVLPFGLPRGTWRIARDDINLEHAALGFGLGGYRYTTHRTVADKKKGPEATLVLGDAAVAARAERMVAATFCVRDLINAPANFLGPEELAEAARDVAKRGQATFKVIVGDKLLAAGWPAVHAVGKGSPRAPRLIEIVGGRARGPKVTIVGKGVCFDSGGLDLKPSSGMLLMKKDMGGAAHAIGLAQAILDADLPVRLRVLIPAVENSVDGHSFRPLDVINTRKGLTVEVGNTDAEGRLILCDALTEAVADAPDLIIDFATLTGAARVALGTEVPVLFANDDDVADALLRAGRAVEDPLWQLPLWRPYRRQLESATADLSNVSTSSYGGAITAALFLAEFVDPKIPWIHIDHMAWNLDDRPGRPRGGEAMGLRAVMAFLETRYGTTAVRKTPKSPKTSKASMTSKASKPKAQVTRGGPNRRRAKGA